MRQPLLYIFIFLVFSYAIIYLKYLTKINVVSWGDNMPQSLLHSISSYAFQYSEVMSEVLGVDVEIVDTNFVRIAGTGIYNTGIGKSIEYEGFVYRKVFETGEKMLIENPGKHPICKSCTKYKRCEEKFEICSPIKVENRVVGVIGLICFDEKQRDKVVSNLESYLKFLDKISELISAKAVEQKSFETQKNAVGFLNRVMDHINDGVLILDEDSNIMNYNKKAESILGISNKKSLPMKITIEEYGPEINSNDGLKYCIILKGSRINIYGKLYDFMDAEGKDVKVLIFQDLLYIHQEAAKITEGTASFSFDKLIGEDKNFIAVKKRARKVADSNSTILIIGESGTGKELFARAIHNASHRNNKPFVAINCGAIPDTLLESELFGYESGSFTGANKKGKLGKFELANGGTIFLDEIGDMPIHLQVKLLRVLQERTVEKIGGYKPIPIDVRIIAATNRNLSSMVKEGEFREDLYYRLSVIPIEIPPLRERKKDIRLFLDYFIKNYSILFNRQNIEIDSKVKFILENYSWPGNIREFQNIVEYMVSTMPEDRKITEECLPKKLVEKRYIPSPSSTFKLKDIEKQVIIQALRKFGCSTEDKKIVAKELDISLSTLYRKLEKYNLTKMTSYE